MIIDPLKASPLKSMPT